MGKRPNLRYVSFLRAINVGGKNLVRMADVRACLESLGFSHVRTYIQSGNILFESDRLDAGKLTTTIENAYSATFKHDVPVFLRSERQLRKIIAQAPNDWSISTTLRRNVAFLRRPLTATQVIRQIRLKHGVDSAAAGDGVVYMSTLMSHLKQSGFPRIVGTPIYRDMTIRSFSTCEKILVLMERD